VVRFEDLYLEELVDSFCLVYVDFILNRHIKQERAQGVIHTGGATEVHTQVA
jgi:hypothetical protein